MRELNFGLSKIHTELNEDLRRSRNCFVQNQKDMVKAPTCLRLYSIRRGAYILRSQGIGSFHEIWRRRTAVGGRRLRTNIDKILISLPVTFLCAHLDIIKGVLSNRTFLLNFCSSHGGYAFMGNKRALSAQDVARRHQQTSYITTSSESEF